VEFNLDAAHLAGQVSATASVVDPSTGSVRADTETFTIAQASADQEPNNSVAAASPLGTGGTVSGVLNGTTDSQDVYRFDSDLDGTLEIQIAIAEGGATGPLVLVVRDASGNELRRLTLSDGRPGVVSVAVPAGAAFVTVESSGSASYSISSKFEQADVAVSSVSPMSGPAGTLITINGSGFSSRVLENQVFFSNIAAEVVSATTTQLLVRVPANAVNGAVEVISGDRRFELEGFSTGVATARPKGYGLPSNASAMRQDPTTGELIDITRLVVSATPATDQQSMAATAQRLGGQVVGYVPLSNQYFLEFNQNSSLDGLNAIRRRVEAEPAVRSVDFSRAPRATSVHAIDMLDGSDPTVRRKAFELIHLPEAIDLIRTTPPFIDASGLKTVRVAVIDSGFQPSVPGEFPGTVEFYRSEGLAGLLPSTNFRDVEPSHPDGHGTEVTSVIAALNDEVTPVSGFLNSLVSAQEAPFGVVNYGWLSNLDQVGIYLALENIKTRGNIDVVNMSLAFNADISTLVQALRGRTLVVAAAGNDGIRNTDKPARLASTEPNVMAVGAVAVANIDGSGETADQRARFQGAQGALSAVSARCDPLDTGPRYSIAGSNCGPSITIAAPGEDLYAVTKAGSGPDHKYFGGTSGASPVVASIAAILQAVRPTLAPLPPSDVRSILKRTATDISSSWGSPMGRVDALAAVESLLAPHSPETVLVTDGEAPPTTGSQPGALVAFTVDGLTGLPTQASQTIDLNETGEDIGHPRTIAVAPDGNAAYVFAETAGAQGGEGLVVVSARNRKALNFIPLSGTRGANPPTPLRTGDPRPPMVVSKDGRIVYVAAGKRLHVVNAVDGLDVFSFADLPAPYNALASQVSGSLEQKFQALDSNLDAGAVTARPATRISALALSPDGATLFMTIQSAGGAGIQPGYVLALNVNLYSDASSDYGLQSDLTNYLLPAKYFGPSYAIPHSDEPSDVAVSPDGRFLYVVNGGFASFSPPDLTKSATTYGLSVATESNGGVTVVTADQQARNKEEFESGYTVMNAPGVIEAYPTETNGPGGPRFPSTIDYGWQPSAASGGLVLSPYRFPYVFGRRPFSISIRPDGQRALVAFFQTGNFGVMDLDAQRFFAPSARNVAAGYFAGIVGLTPSVKLDKNLWPLRDQFDLPGGGKASPDEKLLFPTQVEYSQSGRFAVGIHTGATRPVPPTTPGSNEGGAVSFINDEVIGRDLTANASSIFEPSFDGTRAYYSMNPICDTANTATNSCVSSPVTSVFDYTSGGQSKRFAVPRGLAIAPEFSVVTPAFGDHIVPTGEITLRWSGDPVVVRFRLLEGGTVSAPTNYGPLTNGAIYFSADERLTRRMKRTATVFFNSLPVGPLRRCRLELDLENSLGIVVATTTIDFVVTR
jgi:hypothetical protein